MSGPGATVTGKKEEKEDEKGEHTCVPQGARYIQRKGRGKEGISEEKGGK
jgi:hypothetical protein